MASDDPQRQSDARDVSGRTNNKPKRKPVSRATERRKSCSSDERDRREENAHLYSNSAVLQRILDCFTDVMLEDAARKMDDKDAPRRIVPSVADALRALQVRRDFADAEEPRRMEVQWLESYAGT